MNLSQPFPKKAHGWSTCTWRCSASLIYKGSVHISSTARYHTHQKRLSPKKQQTAILIRTRGKGNPCALLAEMWIGDPSRKTLWRFLKKLSIETPYHPETPFLVTDFLKKEALILNDICNSIATVALFTIAKAYESNLSAQ